jgi:hypothetical protein
MSLRSVLFPDPPRDFRGRRGIKTGLRAFHVLSAAALLGATLYGAAASDRDRALGFVIASGAALTALELARTAAFLLQVRGAVLVLKLAAVALFTILERGQSALLAAILVGSVLISHAPASIRHRMLAGGGRIRGADTRD